MGNIRRAMAWSCSPAGDRSIGLRLTEAMARLSPGHALLRECHEWCQHALGLMQEPGLALSLDFDLRDALQISLLHALGNCEEAAAGRGLQFA